MNDTSFAIREYVIDRRNKGDKLRTIAARMGKSVERIRQLEWKGRSRYVREFRFVTSRHIECLRAIAEE